MLTSCLHAGAASALSFNFSFSGFGIPSNPATVTGIVDGLMDNQNDQKTGLTVTVTSATNAGTLPDSFTDTNYITGGGFDVSGGQVTGVDIVYIRYGNYAYLELVNNGNGTSSDYTDLNLFDNYDPDPSPSSSLVFTPVVSASVPGPLPLFGAGAAFGWSRRLRRRIKSPA